MSCSTQETYQLITNGSLIPTQLLLEVDIRIHVNRGDGSKGCNNLSGTMEQFGYNNLSITSCHHELRPRFPPVTCRCCRHPLQFEIYLKGSPDVHLDFGMLITHKHTLPLFEACKQNLIIEVCPLREVNCCEGNKKQSVNYTLYNCSKFRENNILAM